MKPEWGLTPNLPNLAAAQALSDKLAGKPTPNFNYNSTTTTGVQICRALFRLGAAEG